MALLKGFTPSNLISTGGSYTTAHVIKYYTNTTIDLSQYSSSGIKTYAKLKDKQAMKITCDIIEDDDK